MAEALARATELIKAGNMVLLKNTLKKLGINNVKELPESQLAIFMALTNPERGE